jgi:hypothetical protein
MEHNTMDKSQWRIRGGFIAFFLGLVLLCLLAGLFLPTYIGVKPTMSDIAVRGCKDYLEYAKFASTNGAFKSNFSRVSEFKRGNSLLAIFNTNRNFWAKTNFTVSILKPEPAILCKQQFYYPRFKNSFGCSYSQLKPAFVIGYSDGTTALISQEQFTNLNLSGFIPLSSIGIEDKH